MTELNPTDPKSTPLNPTSKATVSPDVVRQFKNIFAQINTQKPEEDPEPKDQKKAPHSPSKPSSPSTSEPIQLKKDTLIFQQMFKDMGTDDVEQIQAVFIQIHQRVQETPISTSIQPIVHVQLHQQPVPIRISLTPTANQSPHIQIACDPQLHALISQHLPQLKDYLKKKGILFNDIELSIDTLNTKSPTTPGPLKNRIQIS